MKTRSAKIFLLAFFILKNFFLGEFYFYSFSVNFWQGYKYRAKYFFFLHLLSIVWFDISMSMEEKDCKKRKKD